MCSMTSYDYSPSQVSANQECNLNQHEALEALALLFLSAIVIVKSEWRALLSFGTQGSSLCLLVS